MVTLAVSTWHANPNLLHEQIVNYNAAFSGDIIHMININSDFKEKFWADAHRYEVNFNKVGNVFFMERPVQTYYAGIAHAYLAAVQEAIRRKISFDYIYFHTSSDLLVKPGLNRFIRKFDIGFSQSKGWPLEYQVGEDGIEMAVVEKMLNSVWKEPIENNRYAGAVLRAIGAERLYQSRSEGCFFSRDIFFEIIFPLISNISIREMSYPAAPYPIEEFMFAQCVEFFCDRNNVRRTNNVILTSQNKKQLASIEDIDKTIEFTNKFGVKRFDENLSSIERIYIRELLNLS